jgi:hypothetical protein
LYISLIPFFVLSCFFISFYFIFLLPFSFIFSFVTFRSFASSHPSSEGAVLLFLHLWFYITTLSVAHNIQRGMGRMNTAIFWNTTLYSPLRVNWLFGGTCRLHLQGWGMSRICLLLHAGFLFDLLFDLELGDEMFFRNVVRFSTHYTSLYPNR